MVVTDVSPGAIVANLETQTSYSNPTIAKSFPSTLLSLTFLNKRKGHRHHGGGGFTAFFSPSGLRQCSRIVTKGSSLKERRHAGFGIPASFKSAIKESTEARALNHLTR